MGYWSRYFLSLIHPSPQGVQLASGPWGGVLRKSLVVGGETRPFPFCTEHFFGKTSPSNAFGADIFFGAKGI